VTVVNDLDKGVVLAVLDDRDEKTTGEYLDTLGEARLDGIKRVAIDMWGSYISAVSKVIPKGPSKICFDRFHVAKKLDEAVDQVRRKEHKQLGQQGSEILKITKGSIGLSPKTIGISVCDGEGVVIIGERGRCCPQHIPMHDPRD
jgi:transposase